MCFTFTLSLFVRYELYLFEIRRSTFTINAQIRNLFHNAAQTESFVTFMLHIVNKNKMCSSRPVTVIK